ncbi:MAG: PTS sugar transporter subunit IIC [Pseudomonadota bacterium]|nr:PTS sugar transporter subunit IIC [Pseudomonadota bacterium]
MNILVSLTAALKIAGVGALLSLDRTAWGQLMISRPVVTAPIIGLACGNAAVGLLVGVLIELLWINELPVGSAIPSDDALFAAVASGVITSIVTSRNISDPVSIGSLIFLVFATMIPLASQGKKIDIMVRKYNEKILTEMETRLLVGNPDQAVSLHLKGLLHFLVCNFVAILVSSGTLLLAMPYLHSLIPASIQRIMNGLLIIFPLVGIATLLAGIHKKNILTLFMLLALGFSFLL